MGGLTNMRTGVLKVSQWYDENDSEQQTDNQQTGKGLRAQLEKALAELETTRKESSELANKYRRAEIAGFLRDNGWNPKVARYIPPDVDPTPDALNKWVDEEGSELFGLKRSESDSEAPKEPEASEASTAVPADAQEAFRAISASTSGALPPQGKETDQLSHMMSLDENQLREYLRVNGAQF